MTFPPIDKTFEGVWKDTLRRLTIVERRLGTGGGGGGGGGGTTITAAEPAGVIKMWGSGMTVPEGYLLCNGAAVSRTAYAALFAAIGTQFGAGDGSTTFNVPNFLERGPVGHNTGFTFGQTLGSATHTHPLDDDVSGNAWADINWAAAGQIYLRRASSGPSWTANVRTVSSTLAPVTGDSTAISGGGIILGGNTEAASSYQPSLMVRFIIKATAGTDPVDSTYNNRLAVLEEDTGWANVSTFATGASAGAGGARYRRVGKLVRLAGSLNIPATSAATWTLMFTLPEGFRPTADARFPLASGVHVVTGTFNVVAATGAVQVYMQAAAGVSTNVPISHIAFFND